MWLQVLGSAAGGGFPQWNCGCPGCRAVRLGSRSTPRTQSSVAVSIDRRRWFLLNASPDIRGQIEAFPPLHPEDGRITPLEAVLLTDAELDHTLGLLLLRESPALQVHATPAVYDILRSGTAVLATLERYCRVDWHPVVPGADVPLANGLSYRAFDVPTTKRGRFGAGTERGQVVGYRLHDEHNGHTAIYLPGMQRLTAEVREQLNDCACLLVDGTCWDDDELILLGVATKTATEMGHMPVGGPNGSLEKISGLPIERKIYIHINNTNPILLEDSPQRRTATEHGVEVAVDGLAIKV
ncbi:MAG TPA: pyrroloquinoline quinone biosynthesis protein PqqB [Pseudonocardiaceae bacterium]|nr:pyrroloquinoline quinone biosynthesis protein PqqB [Pseudonocardiaceae bacterium]